MFLDPAAVNEYKNYVATELGSDAAGENPTAKSSEEEERGFFREAGSFAYDMYLSKNLRDRKSQGETDIYHKSTLQQQMNDITDDAYQELQAEYDELRYPDLEDFFDSFNTKQDNSDMDIHPVRNEVQGVIAPT